MGPELKESLETKLQQFGEWAEALIPGVLLYNQIREIKKGDTPQNREIREILTNGSIKQKAFLYAQCAAGEVIVDLVRVGGVAYIIYLANNLQK